MASFRRTKSRSFMVFIVLSVILYYICVKGIFSTISSRRDDITSNPTKVIVAASLKDDDTSWIRKELSDWEAKIYVVDSPEAKYTVPLNKGRESMVYLTYIIDHYDSLPDVIVFIHSQRYQWHNDDPLYDNVPIIRSLRLPFVTKTGYAPLRCTWVPGCPSELHPLNPTDEGRETRKLTERAYAAAFSELLPDIPVPEAVGAPCSSQIAVSRETVWRRPKSSYERMQKWLIETELSDKISGRVMEYTWHIIMQMPTVYCPPAGQCYCMTFGLCDLKCTAARWVEENTDGRSQDGTSE
ncbi:hypothetical protein AJ80_08204 [Polytolypa hystricis UAMH7299]|uniref:Uncharacterized protein n=1 Tax=Polytolypa hystricis (strain UAMH7299) TaxID=1447883 RepID=A0A2B7XB78_POLH7|nr:hypothetical protein AJ80_08204 [Polytolypa hystricis UAMH7299]